MIVPIKMVMDMSVVITVRSMWVLLFISFPSTLSILSLPTFVNDFNTSVITFYEDKCGSNNLCLGGGNFTGIYDCDSCSCNEMCWQYGNCCPDLAIQMGNMTTPTYACQQVDFPLHHRNIGVFMRTRCPSSVSTSNYARCSEDRGLHYLQSPVTSLDDTTYSSYFYASYHYATLVKPWMTYIKCLILTIQNRTDVLNDFHIWIKNDMCRLHYHQPAFIKTETCRFYKYSTCYHTNTWLTEACKKFYGVFGNFKNIFCYACRNSERQYGPVTINSALDYRYPTTPNTVNISLPVKCQYNGSILVSLYNATYNNYRNIALCTLTLIIYIYIYHCLSVAFCRELFRFCAMYSFCMFLFQMSPSLA